jgi:hypothetical protein
MVITHKLGNLLDNFEACRDGSIDVSSKVRNARNGLKSKVSRHCAHVAWWREVLRFCPEEA